MPTSHIIISGRENPGAKHNFKKSKEKRKNMNKNTRESDEHLYPEVYKKLAPVAEQLIRDMEKQHGDIYMTEDLLRQMVDEAIRRAELDTPADVPASADVPAEEAVPVLYQLGRRPQAGGHGHHNQHGHHGGHHGQHGGHWRNYDRGALSDIFNILFLQQIFGRRRPHWRWR